MASVKFGTFAKRRNSTKQPTTELSDQRTVYLKEACSQDKPVFICTGNNFNYNYCEWDGKYYFIDEIRSLRNNEIEIHCIMDPLATYKSEILASTQFISYSSQVGDIWLPDTRIPLKKNATVAQSVSTMNFLFTDAGFYVLTAVGENGCKTYGLDIGNLNSLLQNVSNWSNNSIWDIVNDDMGLNYDWTSPQNAIESLSKVLTQTGFFGNAYLDAPSCIRSCIWVPFFASFFVSGAGGATIHLGVFDTGVPALPCISTPVSRTVTISIPWQYSDWRRSVCEEVYLYLPLVGMVSIPSDEIVNESSLSITWSATATDGCIAYLVTAGNQVVGTFGANASVNYPLGISQQASAGEIVQSIAAGAEQTISSGLHAVSSPTPSNIASTAMTGINAVYDSINTANKRHNTCIGGIGGGAGCGLSLDAKCFTVAHPTIISPSDMKDTMGVPTMKPMALATLTGFCQCANAHVDAPATAGELDAIDYFLNSGFFIE